MGKNVNLRNKDLRFLMILTCTLLISISTESAGGTSDSGQLRIYHYKYKCKPTCSRSGDLIICADAVYRFAELGTSARINCSDGLTGMKKRTCNRNGRFGEVEDFCVSAEVNNILQLAQNATEVAKQLPTLVKSLADITENANNTTPGNLAASINILNLFSSATIKNVSESTVENFLSTVSSLVDDSTLTTWTSVQNEKNDSSSKLLKSVEDFTRLLSPKNQTFNIIKPNIQLKGIKVAPSKNYDIEFSDIKIKNKSTTNAVYIDKNDLEKLTKDSLVMSIALPTMNEILKEPTDNLILNSLVMSTTAENKDITIKMYLMPLDTTLNLSSAQCVFWTMQAGKWDSYGCNHELNGSSVICTCNHLTSFSLLMSKNMNQLKSTKSFNTITKIALGVSVASLIIGILIEAIVWMDVTKNKTSLARHIAILNIALSLLALDILFIAHDFLKPKSLKCTAVIFCLHFSFLALFFWMFTLGLLLLYHLVFLFKDFSRSSMMIISFSLGYACPLVISVSAFVYAHIRKEYTAMNLCWINKKVFYLELIFTYLPLAIVGINFFITLFAIVKILRPDIGEKTGSNINERSSVKKILRCIIILTPLLGLGWVLGFMLLNKFPHDALRYLFDIVNGLQGFFVLLFGIITDEKVQEAMKKQALSKTPSQRMLFTTNSSTSSSNTY
ncbi:adhesion G protein-coupled receptor F5-like [Hemitrygon akajei]|uniref:adhesion G protein-coupled receptor F5-like n=1 Tax=Hemitrygon akajei TaxID=2704970 RepID=UPI003BF9BE2E